MDTIPLPPHGHDFHDWTVPGAADAPPRRYAAELPPPLANARISLGPALASACTDAAMELRMLGRIRPASPGITAMLIQAEATASSLVDGDSASPAALAAAEAGQPSTAAARRITAAAGSLAAHLDFARKAISLGAIAAAHTRPKRMASGAAVARAYRPAQTWVGGSDLWPDGASYVPPHPSRIDAFMHDLVEFCGREDVDPIAQAALAHARVLAVQPFGSAHVRVAGALANGVLRRRGLVTGHVLPISAALMRRKRSHAAATEALAAGDAAPMVSLMAEAIAAATEATARAVAAWEQLPATWERAVGARHGSAARLMTGLLLAHPIVDAASVRRLTGASQASAYEAVARLADAGVITRISPTLRDTTWAALDVFQAPSHLVIDLSGGAAAALRPGRQRGGRRAAA